ncbi:rop guanine nucleotide exchange factor 12-like [Cornus florida]|uniref:rop guanine nucleotide exchange factor 12-like n=1 Tax=Cornus florida TaxID=4283 RepID=UPI0028A1B34A|nr:rop guanine nucleotide exchange factor 12-like [Cornus florida]
MVRALDEEKEIYKSRLFRYKQMHENPGPKNETLPLDISGPMSGLDSLSKTLNDQPKEKKYVTSPTMLKNLTDQPKEKKTVINPTMSKRQTPSRNDKDPPKSRDSGAGDPQNKEKQQPSGNLVLDMELMKERFAKLLLGEDMSGGGKGVSSALALSNAITNLAASVFGEQGKLEPMPPERKARWRREIDWLLSVTDHIVEFAPSKQISKDGTEMEIMTTRQRTDLCLNIPALRKLDAMLLDCLENFRDQTEFSYISKDAPESEKRKDDKWWLPTPKLPPNGLSDVTRKWLKYQKDCVNQVLKAAMAINAQVLAEMEIPESYIETLPKNGRASLGDVIYRSITDEIFDPDYFLATVDLSSDHKILDLKNKIEASIVIWRRKMTAKDGKSSWSSAVSLEKREQFEDRLETVLIILKHRFPGLSQSSLDITKIQYNRDVGQAVLESYSRIIESFAVTVMSRIDDVLHADFVVREQKRSPVEDSSAVKEFWNLDNGELDLKELKEDIIFTKPPNISTKKKLTYLERLETLSGFKSPTGRRW